ncbi:MAG: HAMP domain-containing histidine kinase [Oscillospiraceae bacterium]|nr:HAMP domain-containing histidine kinase [Oscillospiraceae bacterium]
MKSFIIRMLLMTAVFVIAAAALNTAARKSIQERYSERNVVVNRICDEMNRYIAEGGDRTRLADDVFYGRLPEWEQLYGRQYCPASAKIMFFGGREDVSGGSNSMICMLHDGDKAIGAVVFSFTDPGYNTMLTIMNIAFGVCGLFILIYSCFIFESILRPFNKLSDYPEKLSKGYLVERLPEKQSGFFGRYVWSMNMLSDKLEHDRDIIRHMAAERDSFVTALVHGIKTPAANIKLLSEAIATGLYDPEGKINETDAQLAGRIEKNVDEIEHIVKDVVETGASVIYEADPDAKPFYSRHLAELVCEEYSDRLKIEKIPFETDIRTDAMIKSDIEGVRRIVRQLMDNAIKYGDGTGITLIIDKREEGDFITVKNNGTPLPQTELPFVWKSMWRGSNSDGIKGSGVGLYESRFIARKLGGDMYMTAEGSVTEVTLFLPQQ